MRLVGVDPSFGRVTTFRVGSHPNYPNKSVLGTEKNFDQHDGAKFRDSERGQKCLRTLETPHIAPPPCGIFTLGDVRSFFGLTSKIPPLSFLSNFDADV